MKNTLDYLKFDTVEFKRKEFMDKLTNHPELLKNFSIDRLEIILKYYLKENEKKKIKLKKLGI